MQPARIGRIAAQVALAVVVAVAIVVAIVYGLSEYRLRRSHDVPLEAVAVPAGPEALALGRRRAISLGCFDGCHGLDALGGQWLDEPRLALITAPNLTEILPTYSDAELARLLRYGVRRDGTTAIDMPSYMFYHLSEADLGSVIAFMRTLKTQPGLVRQREFGWLGRWALATGKWTTSVADVDRDAPAAGAQPLDTAAARGRYVAMITCPECHGPALEGFPGDTPPLTIIAAYSFGEFSTLMRTGVGKGGRDLKLMSMIGRTRTPQLTDQEVADLYAFLRSRLAADGQT